MSYYGVPVKITEGDRDSDRQAALYALGRSQPGPIRTNAPPGSSAHEYGAAFDFVFVHEGYAAPDNYWEFAGQVGEWLGLVWGGRFTRLLDRPHFELPGWIKYKDA